MSHAERHTASPEKNTEHLSAAASERSKELRERLEHNLENKERDQHEVAAERARIEALFSKEKGKKETKTHHADADPGRHPATKKQREVSYKQTMKRVRATMPSHQRLFSLFIHNRAVEKVSDITGNTVARPNAILAGGLGAFVFVSVIYVLASTMGFRLSGFETIGAFILGWMIGMSYDLFKAMITGKRP
jgi:hypothetical protein